MAAPEIRVEPATGGWSVRAQGAVLGETTNALILYEGDFEPVVYIPRADLQMVFFDRSDTTSTCPHKGEARFFHLAGKSKQVKDVAWSYESPTFELAALKGHLAFYPDKVTVESLG